MRGTAYDAMFIGRNVVPSLVSDLRVTVTITIIEDVKVVSNQGNDDCAYNSTRLLYSGPRPVSRWRLTYGLWKR